MLEKYRKNKLNENKLIPFGWFLRDFSFECGDEFNPSGVSYLCLMRSYGWIELAELGSIINKYVEGIVLTFEI